MCSIEADSISQINSKDEKGGVKEHIEFLNFLDSKEKENFFGEKFIENGHLQQALWKFGEFF